MKRLSLVVLMIALATGVLGQVSLKSTAPPTGGGGGGIAYDSVSHLAPPANAPITWSHAVVGTSNTVLIVVTAGTNGNNASTCTFNGVSMNSVTHFNFPSFYDITVLQLTGVTGTHDIVCSNVSNGKMGGAAIALTGANQSTPIRGTAATATNGTGTSSVTVNSATGDMVVDVAMALTNDGVMSAGGGQDARYTGGFDQDTPHNVFSGSTKAGAASVNMTWTWAPGNDSWGAVAVSVQPQ